MGPRRGGQGREGSIGSPTSPGPSTLLVPPRSLVHPSEPQATARSTPTGYYVRSYVANLGPGRFVSLLTSTDQRCLFCTGSLRRYPLEHGPGTMGDERSIEILWSQCLECGFSVPTSTTHPELVFGDRDRIDRLTERGTAALVLPPEAVVRFHPARFLQIVNACLEAGFRKVHLELLGDELVAGRYLEHWRGSDEDETWIRSTSDLVVRYLRLRHPELMARLVPVVSPAEATARHLRALSDTDDDGTEVVYAGLGPPAANGSSSYVPFTLDGLAELLEERDIDPTGMPDELADPSMLRRRHLSVPGGLPRQMLEEQRESSSDFHRIRDLRGLTEIARALEGGEEGYGFVDALPFESPLTHPALADVEPRDLLQRRRLVSELEEPRSDEPVVEPAEGLDLSADFSGDDESRVPVLEVEDAATTMAQMGVRLEDLLDGRRALSTCPFRMGDRYQDALEDTLHDPTTGVLSHEAFRQRFEEEVARATRYGTQMALLLLEIDEHEAIVEERGHGADRALMQTMGQIILTSVRETDVVGRIGSNRMGVVLVDPTPEGVTKVADKVRRRLEEASETTHEGASLGTVTASVGIAYHSGKTRGALTAEDLFAEADASLYIARAQGGNRVHPSMSEELDTHES